MSVKKRHPIRDSDRRRLIEDLKPLLGAEIERLLDGKVETAELDSGKTVVLANDQPALIKNDEEYLPLISVADTISLKRVTVDMGAVKPISDGADIMAPGIVEVDENIAEGEIVAIEDEKNRKTIAIGTTLEEGSDLKGEKGKVIENLHYIGDKFWNLEEKL